MLGAEPGLFIATMIYEEWVIIVTLLLLFS
jgi:hypothetical protein